MATAAPHRMILVGLGSDRITTVSLLLRDERGAGANNGEHDLLSASSPPLSPMSERMSVLCGVYSWAIFDEPTTARRARRRRAGTRGTARGTCPRRNARGRPRPRLYWPSRRSEAAAPSIGPWGRSLFRPGRNASSSGRTAALCLRSASHVSPAFCPSSRG